MTKEQFINKWGSGNKIFIQNLESLIVTEIAKAQEAQPEKAKPQPAINLIPWAYLNYKPIRYIDWNTTSWIKKHCEGYSIDERGKVYKNDSIQFNFDESPQHWELYTDPAEKPAQPSSQGKLDNLFDRDRFEAMFRAVVASGKNEHWEDDINVAKWAIEQLDAFYASKEGGNNEQI